MAKKTVKQDYALENIPISKDNIDNVNVVECAKPTKDLQKEYNEYMKNKKLKGEN
ncbi:MAG: hypothetical protein IJS60_08880 [Abditibacteriota bacterium]|nr:hypothetical protein [Abditibacteriota bacterium]